MLRRLGIDHIALNPEASYRGLHESMENHLGTDVSQVWVIVSIY